MSEAKFTKGDWVANGAFVGHVDLGCDAIVSGAGCKEIFFKEAEANAHLIAAAPEMYEFIEAYMGGHPEAEQLLAKARGES